MLLLMMMISICTENGNHLPFLSDHKPLVELNKNTSELNVPMKANNNLSLSMAVMSLYPTLGGQFFSAGPMGTEYSSRRKNKLTLYRLEGNFCY